ncbi:MAG TPA: universal stress protein [Steroidobacteraceae bacterium]|nr:universal stress protein [Steroidobacteraceae bacterium]
MSVFSSLLVCLDGSQAAARALRCAAWLGARLEARTHVVSATSCPLPVRQELTRLRVPESNWPQLTLHQVMGVPEEAILGLADRYDIGLIVLSAHGEGTSLGNVGHVARAVLEQTNRPVLLLPKAYRERLPWTQALIPLSAEAEVSPAARVAVALAHVLALDVRIAHVLDDPESRTGLEAAVPYADAPYHEYPEQLAEIVRRTVSGASPEQCRRITDVALLRGDVAMALLREAEGNDVSVIAIGWHGTLLGGRARLVKHLLSAITCPILLVKIEPPGPFVLKVGPRMG